ncbi:MAG: helix-turn-helix transcriptional regulator [Alphaproteobacteria bacterium]|nr:helix-turn-helix transcriptional regulator [Alphaproteobacteria bacterium]
MAALELGLRGAAIALLLLWAVLLLRDARERLGAAFAAGVASYAVCSAPGFVPPTGLDWHLLVLTICIANPAMFWLFARRLFEDGFNPTRTHWLGYTAYALVGSAIFLLAQRSRAVDRPALFLVLTLGTIGFAVATAWTIWRGHRDDLVEQRRRLRPILMGAAVLYVVGIGVSELGFRGAPPPATLTLLNAAALAGFAVATLLAFVRGPTADLFVPVRATIPIPAVAPVTDALVEPLLALFLQDRLHREPELAVADVARKLGVAEHRLRTLINQQLGHRNFAAFVNGYRLAEAKAALSDPKQAAVPVSTIALDSGFGSLGVFNRAFKAETGQTPTAFRQSALSRDKS